MNATRISKKVWIFVSLVLFLAGCAAGGDAKSPAGGYGGGGNGPTTASAAEPQASQPGAYPQANMERAPQAGTASMDAPSMAPPAPPPASAPRTAGAPSPSKAAPTTPSSGDARPRSAQAEASAVPTPAPSTRPGLGTEFGEARVSRVHDVTFVRDGGRPFAIASLNYNDKKGVDALAASARTESSRSVGAGSGAITISVRDASGSPLEAVKSGDRTLVVGQAGQRYSIVLTNNTSHRFEAVGTVDGLDVINGKPGTFENRGYVLLPFATLEIEGFRTSTAQVAAFRFAAVADSYAAQTGSARNVGVIGLAFFSERGDAFVPESEVRLRETASPFPADPRFSQPPPRR